MQASAVVETASGKSHHSNGGSGQKDEPSNPKKENLLSSNGCNEARLTFLDAWDFSAPKQRTNDKKISSIDKIHLLAPYFSASSGTTTKHLLCPSDESEDSADYASFSETFFTPSSDTKLKSENLFHLDSEFDSEMQKREEVFFDILKYQGSKMNGLERIFKISDDYNETAEDVQNHYKAEDLRQAYHTAKEAEYLRNRLSLDQTKASDLSNLEVIALRNSGYAVKCASDLEANHVGLESGPGISLDSVDVYGQEDSPFASKFQNSVMLRDYHEPKYEKCKEQENSLMYHTAIDEIVLSSLLENQEYPSKTGFLNPQKALKTKIYAGKMKSQVTKTKDFCGNAKVENRMSHLEDPSPLPPFKALETLQQPDKDYQTSWTSIFDDSVISDCEYSHYKSLQNTPNSALDFSLALPKVGVQDNQAIKEDNSLTVANASTTNKGVDAMEGLCPASVAGAAPCTVTVNQAVDVSADFRACFTTSRATNTRPSVVPTSSNTKVTMSRERPGERQSEKQTSGACDTDGLCGEDNEDTHVAVTKGSLGKSVSEGSFLNKDSLELRKTFAIADLKEHPETEPQLSKAMEKNLPSECCQNTMQRALQAEMHLLNVQFQICCRYCIDIYKLVMENREGLNRNLSSNSKKELGSALLSVLGDLKVKYVNLKEKLNKGIPLEELPPLSVEAKLLSTFSTFASRLMTKEPHIFSGADSALDNRSTPDVDVSSSLKQTHSRMSLSPDISHPNQGMSPKEAGLKNGGVDVHFSQLKLDDKDYKNYQEMSEDWFDAKENLTGVDFSGIQENPIEQEKGTVEPLHQDKGYSLHVGGLCPSVSEADLRSHFQKYQVSEISIYNSTNYRYASLALKRSSDAKMAVKEMNGIEINGKSVNVRLVKTPRDYISPLPSKNGHRASLNNLEKRTSKEINSASSISRLPRTQPRQLGSEQDSEFFHSDQKCIKKNCKQTESTKSLPNTPAPNTLKLCSFTKIIKRLTELHPEVSRDHIIDALQEIRMRHKGFLNGFSINTIVEMTSSVLKNSASRISLESMSSLVQTVFSST